METWHVSGVKMAAWELLKQFGRNPLGELKKNYWQAVLFSFFVVVISVGINVLFDHLGWEDGFKGWMVNMGLSLFLLNPLNVAANQYYLWQKQGFCRPKQALFSSFQGNRYGGIVAGMFFYGLFISLWSLLFLIPGIIKGYAYRMVPFLLAENPTLSWRRALEISKQTTYGEKMDMFVLDLSFIGWIFLCIVTVGVGAVFFMPYYLSTLCEVYTHQRTKALNNGWVSREELEDPSGMIRL